VAALVDTSADASAVAGHLAAGTEETSAVLAGWGAGAPSGRV
jgi:hypothetical protein